MKDIDFIVISCLFTDFRLFPALFNYRSTFAIFALLTDKDFFCDKYLKTLC